MYENSDRFRDDVNLERYGINPTVTVAAGEPTPGSRRTTSTSTTTAPPTAASPRSRAGPAETDVRTFFGDPAQSWSDASINVGTAAHRARPVADGPASATAPCSATTTRSTRTSSPARWTRTGTLVSISAYNNRNDRDNLVQPDRPHLACRSPAGVGHTLLAGVELGRQVTDNLRNTGFFDNTATSVTAPLANPTDRRGRSPSARARPTPTTASRTTSRRLYLQDQVDADPLPAADRRRPARAVRPRPSTTTGTARTSSRTDDLVSPRAGLVVKPVEPLSVYGSYSVSYLPSSGDQFSLAHRDHRDAGAGEVQELRGGRQARRGDAGSR